MASNEKVAFLGYDRKETSLVEEIERRGFDVEFHKDQLDDLSSFERVVSFGYRHLLKPEVLATSKYPVLNLHIAYLPYNKGAHPNFWSWVKGTPSGVTIHEIDAGIDTGPIVDQRQVSIEPDGLTFRDTYEILFREMETLFIERASSILNGSYRTTSQSGTGSFHRVADLPDWVSSWDMQVTDAIARYKNDE